MAEVLAGDAAADNDVLNAARDDKQESKDGPRKRKVALYAAYIGAGYSGMQANPGQKTIESALEAAIYRAGGISKENAGSFSKVKWMRSARTDKGVSAVGQVVSLKLLVGDPQLVQKINKELPKEIVVLGYTQVTGSFDARLLCDKRRYEYILPAGALWQETAEPSEPAAAPTTEIEARDGKAQASLGEQEISRLNALLKQYEGTHKFHNFTIKVAASDSSSRRYILSFKSPGLMQIKGKPWVKLVVTGQSFMLHQIRKMVGLAVAVFLGLAPPNAISMALDPTRKVNTPIAPDVGLFLDESIFDSYNQRWAERGMKVSLEPYESEIAAFKRNMLYPQIAERNELEGCTANWLKDLRAHKKELMGSFALDTPQIEKEDGSTDQPESKRLKVEHDS